MIDNKRLSIIVPIYNVEKYLAKCIDSLLSQDFPHDSYEVILVNDGSTDKSVEIANKYAAQNFGCVKLINQNNQGLSAARNSGIIAAKGKYLMFVDSDDYVESNIIGKLLKRAETLDLDILRFNYRNVNELYETISPYKDPKRFVDYSENVCDGETFLDERLGLACYACQFLVKRSLLSDESSLFRIGIYFEDTEWTPRILVKAKRVSSIDIVAYNYLLRQGSITQATDEKKRLKLYDDTLFVIGELKKQSCTREKKSWYKRMIALMVVSLLGRLKYEGKEVQKEKTRQLKQLEVFPLTTEKSKVTVKLKICLINVSPCLFMRLDNYKFSIKE